MIFPEMFSFYLYVFFTNSEIEEYSGKLLMNSRAGFNSLANFNKVGDLYEPPLIKKKKTGTDVFYHQE